MADAGASARRERDDGGCVRVLHVAEKPSLAACIAASLSRGTHTTLKGEIETHELRREWRGKRALHRVTSVRGELGTCMQGRLRCDATRETTCSTVQDMQMRS